MAGRSSNQQAERRARKTASRARSRRDVPPPDLDRLIHERFRLGIMSALSVNESLSFKDLKTMLEATDGNLSVHSRKLEEEGYIGVMKTFDGRVPKTRFRITTKGRQALDHYLTQMEALIRLMRDA
jgi:DNA-binding MarR family transcriptional regulator